MLLKIARTRASVSAREHNCDCAFTFDSFALLPRCTLYNIIENAMYPCNADCMCVRIVCSGDSMDASTPIHCRSGFIYSYSILHIVLIHFSFCSSHHIQISNILCLNREKAHIFNSFRYIIIYIYMHSVRDVCDAVNLFVMCVCGSRENTHTHPRAYSNTYGSILCEMLWPTGMVFISFDCVVVCVDSIWLLFAIIVCWMHSFLLKCSTWCALRIHMRTLAQLSQLFKSICVPSVFLFSLAIQSSSMVASKPSSLLKIPDFEPNICFNLYWHMLFCVFLFVKEKTNTHSLSLFSSLSRKSQKLYGYNY